MHACIFYIYIYIYIQRERERDRFIHTYMLDAGLVVVISARTQALDTHTCNTQCGVSDEEERGKGDREK